MEKVETTLDVSGRELNKGDTVSTLNGAMTARISDIALEGDAAFVRLRPVFQPYGPGIWHAADRVVYVAAGKKKQEQLKAKAEKANSVTDSAAKVGRNGQLARKK